MFIKNLSSSRSFPMVIVLAGLLSTLSGCSSSPASDIQKSVEANMTSVDKSTWEFSAYYPPKIFARWIETATSEDSYTQLQGLVCSALHNIDTQKLALFESEFENISNQKLLEPCLTSLQAKLDNHYKAELAEVREVFSASNWQPAQRSRTHFKNIIKQRDFSRGYHTTHADLSNKEVILTFDDGPHRTLTPRILESLNAVNAKVIFFPVGTNVKSSPNIVKQTAAQGHFIGSHTYNHPCLGRASECRGLNKGRTYSTADAQSEILRGHKAVEDVLGWVAPFFRFPYGAATTDARNYVKSLKIADFAWNIDSNDWRQQSVANMVRSTIRQVQSQGRGIVLFHDIQRKTAEGLPTFLDQLYELGFDIVLVAPPEFLNGSSNTVY